MSLANRDNFTFLLPNLPCLIIIFFFCNTGVLTQGLVCLTGTCSTTWVIPPSLFALVIVQVGSHVFCPGLSSDSHPPIYGLLHSWDERHMPPCPAYWLRWNLTNFYPGWPWIVILPVSTSSGLGLQMWDGDIVYHHLTHHKFTWLLVYCMFPPTLKCKFHKDKYFLPAFFTALWMVPGS
jgi:hypothetical protein